LTQAVSLVGITSLYVDDLMVTGDEEAEIEHFKENMKAAFEMTYLGTID